MTRNNLPPQSAEETNGRAEESIRKKFHKTLFSRFAQAIVAYGLVSPNDKIAVCISGGKDSFVLAKLFQEIKRHNKFPFDLEFLAMDPGYSPINRERIERNAELLKIPLRIFETDIFENVTHIEKTTCYICARMRRGQIQTMMPKLKSTNFAGMELIRPLYFVREEDIMAWRDYNGLQFLQCACRFTEENYGGENVSSKRLKVKELIKSLKAEDPEIEQNIFKSVENVNLSTVIAYKDKKGEKHFFTEDY